MDSRIQRTTPGRPLKSGQAGSRRGRGERQFVMPRRPEAEDDSGESGAEDTAAGSADEPMDTMELESTVLEPKPRRTSVSISRERLEDEAGQRIDLRG